MPRALKRRLALGVALVAVLAGGTAVALGATGSGHRGAHHHARAGARHGLIAAASGYLGISSSELRAELASGKTLSQLADSTPGRSEAGLLSTLLAAGRQRLHSASTTLQERVQALVQGKPGALARRSLGTGRRHASLRAAAVAYLGIDRKALAADLRAGRTLAQIAEATPGKSAAGLGQAVLAALSRSHTGPRPHARKPAG